MGMHLLLFGKERATFFLGLICLPIPETFFATVYPNVPIILHPLMWGLHAALGNVLWLFIYFYLECISFTRVAEHRKRLIIVVLRVAIFAIVASNLAVELYNLFEPILSKRFASSHVAYLIQRRLEPRLFSVATCAPVIVSLLHDGDLRFPVSPSSVRSLRGQLGARMTQEQNTLVQSLAQQLHEASMTPEYSEARKLWEEQHAAYKAEGKVPEASPGDVWTVLARWLVEHRTETTRKVFVKKLVPGLRKTSIASSAGASVWA